MRRTLIAIVLLLSLHAFSQSKVTEVKLLSPGIYALWLNQYENKSVLAEFEKFLVLVEFPQNDSVANDLIAKAREMFPQKPIRYVLHSHHHPHSISAFDPFLRQTKASLVTTAYNYEEVKRKTRDTAALRQRTILYDSSYVIRDKKNEVVLYEILQQAYTVPTKEYNLAFFPKQQLMVSGCLFNKPESYYEVVNARKPALKKFITDHGLSVQTLVPTNTSKVNGFVDVCSIDMLDSSLVKGIDPYKFMEQFRSKPVEYLESRTDSLITEFSKVPRSFDYLVCGNGLRSVHKDYNRAIIVFKALSRMYPNEYDFYFNIGECYESKGATLEAIAYFNKFASLTQNAEDKQEALDRIRKLTK